MPWCTLWHHRNVKSLKNSRENAAVRQILDSGKFKGVELKGPVPSLAYKTTLLENVRNAITERVFDASDNETVKAATVFDLRNWPAPNSAASEGYWLRNVYYLLIGFIFQTKTYPLTFTSFFPFQFLTIPELPFCRLFYLFCFVLWDVLGMTLTMP